MSNAIRLRPVEPEDCHKGLFEVLSQLTSAPTIPASRFRELVEAQRRGGVQQTIVAVNHGGSIVGTGSVLLEPKFIRGGAPCAHIEDIVVDSKARGQNVGKEIIERLIEFAKDRGCYKVILDCAEGNVPFYEKCGLTKKECQMALYF